MKNSRALIAVLFTGAGLYLLITSLVSLFGMIGSIIPSMTDLKLSFWSYVLPALIPFIMPAIAGALFIGLAGKLANMAIRIANVSLEDDSPDNPPVQELTLLRGVLTAFGIFFLLGQLAMLANGIQWDVVFSESRASIWKSDRLSFGTVAVVKTGLSLILILCANSLSQLLFRFWGMAKNQEPQ
ncbi:MAG: hypothetical protein LBV12_09255 [Puniceicoccales bacterium]|jgi:uncharacterized integral membrane protein|nr:hypothetical protein [Puniceicoccales bacterium]